MTNKIDNTGAGWNFDNSYAKLPKAFYSIISPNPVHSPKLVLLNNPLSTSLGLDIESLKSEEGVAVLAGNRIPEGAPPLAQAYAGNQFGHFTMLGDGRAMLIGEQITPFGERYDIQLKGSGRTPYSRGGDGRAALGPMLREYIISEAMYALGIPTTRSLAVITTGETVNRETAQLGAILTRVASSHIRVGTFQYASKWASLDELKALADYTLQRHYSYVKDEENCYLLLLKEAIKRQAKLIAKWQLVGFIHGVMNTDNMTICGETIDYGPCAFMDAYNPETVFSSIDTQGRYAYGNQEYIGGWNLSRFAETLLPLIHDKQEKAIQLAQDEISHYSELFHLYWIEGFRAKLGLFNIEQADESLIERLLELMNIYKADYTNTFRALTLDNLVDSKLFNAIEFIQWHKKWQERLGRQEESKEFVYNLMKSNNPAVIPRNHRVEEALEAANHGDYSIMQKLLNVLENPYGYSLEQTVYTSPPESCANPYRTFCGT